MIQPLLSENFTKAIIFIDAGVCDPEILANSAQSTVIFLNSSQDGIVQITDTLTSYSNIETIHIVSHGSPGSISLGNSILSLDTLPQYAPKLQQWGVKQILLYGCQVAYGDAGEEFVNKIHQITKASIAASASLTGNSDRGGNWDLEVTKGKVDSAIAFTESVKKSYAGVLEEIVVNTLEDEDDGIDTGDISLREAIEETNELEGRDTIEFDPSLSGGTITLSVGEPLNISDDLTIEGLGAEEITIDGNEVIVFEINDDSEDETINVEIENLSIFNGEFGIINNAEELTIQDSIISDNSIVGIFSLNNATTNITSSTISNNLYGGISGYDGNTISITDSTISDNSSLGIYGYDSNTISVTDSTVSDNLSFGIAGNKSNTISVTNTIISGNSNSAIFGSENNTISVIDSTVSDNYAGVFGSENNTISVTDSTISDNLYGGISGYDGNTISVTDSTISNNSSDGIFGSENNTTSITNSTISDNSGSGISGNENNTTSVASSTISGNSDGGILGDTINITNSTISDNSGDLAVGILITATASIVNTTITNNQAQEGFGSGIIAADGVERIEIANSIVAGNANTDIDIIDDENVFTSLGGNVIGLGNATSAFTATRDVVDVENPLLEELADNGGDTQTHLPLEGSPAIDRGINSEVPEDLDRDQRGAPRIANERVDAGAVEILGVVQGTNDDDFLLGTDLDDTIEGLAGDDLIKGADGNDNLDGGTDDDSLQGAPGEDTIRGGTGNDTIDAGRDPDVLLGGSDNDVLIGGTGNDTLTGGDDRDEFQFNRINERRDVITDFETEADLITISSSGFGGNLSEGILDDELFVSLPRFTDLDESFSLGFVHATEVERLAFIDTDSDIPLTQLAILEGNPELEANNFRIF